MEQAYTSMSFELYHHVYDVIPDWKYDRLRVSEGLRLNQTQHLIDESNTYVTSRRK